MKTGGTKVHPPLGAGTPPHRLFAEDIPKQNKGCAAGPDEIVMQTVIACLISIIQNNYFLYIIRQLEPLWRGVNALAGETEVPKGTLTPPFPRESTATRIYPAGGEGNGVHGCEEVLDLFHCSTPSV